MKLRIFNPTKNLAASVLIAGSLLFFSCQENADTKKNANDSVYSGLEGTREDASQLSNSTIDTSSGKTVTKSVVTDSLDKVKKDSMPVK